MATTQTEAERAASTESTVENSEREESESTTKGLKESSEIVPSSNEIDIERWRKLELSMKIYNDEYNETFASEEEYIEQYEWMKWNYKISVMSPMTHQIDWQICTHAFEPTQKVTKCYFEYLQEKKKNCLICKMDCCIDCMDDAIFDSKVTLREIKILKPPSTVCYDGVTCGLSRKKV